MSKAKRGGSRSGAARNACVRSGEEVTAGTKRRTASNEGAEMAVRTAEATARQMGRAGPTHQHMRVRTSPEDKSEEDGPKGRGGGREENLEKIQKTTGSEKLTT